MRGGCYGVTCRTLRHIPLASSAAPHFPKNRGEDLAYAITAGATEDWQVLANALALGVGGQIISCE